jgi:hypothetical protein
VSGRLDDEKLETLRRWGAGLGADGRDELRAAGKAILILIEEIERLQVDVWHMRGAAHTQFEPGPIPGSESSPDASLREPQEDTAGGPEPAGTEAGLEPTLRGRLRRLLPPRPVKFE